MPPARYMHLFLYLKDSEIAYLKSKSNVIPSVFPIGYDGLAFIVNKNNTDTCITVNEMVSKQKDKRLNKQFLFYVLKNSDFKSVISGSAQPQITRTSLSPLKIPLPPLEIQKEIIEQIKVKQNAIDHAKEIIKSLERERDDILVKHLEN